jgi:cytochrome c peroxidase
MRLHHTFTLSLLSIVVAAGCGKKKEEEPAAPPAAPTAQPPAAAQRPSQGQLPTLPELTLPADPQRDARVELGHMLFFDKRLAADGKKACYDCHPNEHGTGGAEPIAIGALDKKLTRHAPVMWNVGYQKGAFYWDGRSKTLEDQAKAAWTGGNMGVAEDLLEKKVAELAKIPGYQAAVAKAFPGQKATANLLIQAISDYERTLLCTDTRYDRYAKGDKSALDEAEQRGLDVFMSKGMCTICHAPPYFSTSFTIDGGTFFNVGIGTDKPEAEVDIGRMKVSNDPKDWAAFKPPSLRNISRSAPYFHDGSAATLEDAVAVMAGGGKKNKNLTQLMADRKLTDAEKADLIAFLKALDCPGQLEQPKLP